MQYAEYRRPLRFMRPELGGRPQFSVTGNVQVTRGVYDVAPSLEQLTVELWDSALICQQTNWGQVGKGERDHKIPSRRGAESGPDLLVCSVVDGRRGAG